MTNTKTLMEGNGLIPQAARFAVSTGISATLSFVLPIILHELFGVPTKIAVAVSFAIAYLVNIALLRIVVFRSQSSWLRQLLIYIPTNGLFRLAEYLAFVVLLDWAGLDYRLSILLVLGVSAVTKFFVYRIVFGDRRT